MLHFLLQIMHFYCLCFSVIKVLGNTGSLYTDIVTMLFCQFQFCCLCYIVRKKKEIENLSQFALYFKNTYHSYRSGECCQNSIWMNLLSINRTGGYREFNIQLIKSASGRLIIWNNNIFRLRNLSLQKCQSGPGPPQVLMPLSTILCSLPVWQFTL